MKRTNRSAADSTPQDTDPWKHFQAVTDLKVIDPKLILYRFFGKDGELIYVGKTIAVRERMSHHRSNAKFFELAYSVTFTREFATERELLRAETAAIKAELPLYNVADNPRRHPSRPVCPVDQHNKVCDEMPKALLERKYVAFEKLRDDRLSLVKDQMILAMNGDKEAEMRSRQMTRIYSLFLISWTRHKEEQSNGFPSIFTDSTFWQVIEEARLYFDIECIVHERVIEFIQAREQSTAEVPAR